MGVGVENDIEKIDFIRKLNRLFKTFTDISITHHMINEVVNPLDNKIDFVLNIPSFNFPLHINKNYLANCLKDKIPNPFYTQLRCLLIDYTDVEYFEIKMIYNPEFDYGKFHLLPLVFRFKVSQPQQLDLFYDR